MRTDLYYKSGYKYQTSRLFVCRTGILLESDIHTEYISLLTDGTLIIQKGYAWDGPSGPTIDTPDTTAASLMHDAGYQLIREGYLEDCYRAHFDNLLKLTMKQDAAIDCLPDDQKQVIGLLLQGFQIDSKDKNIMTIARILQCDERTVRNRRDRACKALKAILQEENAQ